MDINTFQSLSDSKDKSIVIFSASWCGPCKIQARIVDEINKKYPELGKNIYKEDVDDSDELVANLGIQSIPTLYFLGGGKMVVKNGVQSEEELIAWVN